MVAGSRTAVLFGAAAPSPRRAPSPKRHPGSAWVCWCSWQWRYWQLFDLDGRLVGVDGPLGCALLGFRPISELAVRSAPLAADQRSAAQFADAAGKINPGLFPLGLAHVYYIGARMGAYKAAFSS